MVSSPIAFATGCGGRTHPHSERRPSPAGVYNARWLQLTLSVSRAELWVCIGWATSPKMCQVAGCKL